MILGLTSLSSSTLAVLAALCFGIAGYYTKLSRGLTVPGPSAKLFGLFVLGAALQAVAMRREPMAITYVFVLGIEAVAAFVLSVWLLGESASAVRMVGMALVVAGIILLKTGNP
jgi:quaternary ammonium compound-resistance protein SugE